MIFDEPTFSLDAKSIHKLSTKGLSIKTLREQIHDDLDFLLQLWHAQGLEIVKQSGSFYFTTAFKPMSESTFCIVDIETNGSKIEKHQIIEIAALKVKNGLVVERFESLVECHEINPHITEITGISTNETIDAPNLKKVMYDFRTFLGDAVFIAHDVKFDYKFISLSMQKIGLPPLLNRSLCSLSLAERTIESYRYALSYLNTIFNLHPEATHHRAMSDVITTYELFKLSLNSVDKEVKTVEDLIRFSKEAKRLKRPKFDPRLEDQE
ncbi:Exonuclease [Sulfurimonas denitrificans DSM 1251]|jgi:DNA polymerase-3 subunit epsilon|uniref:Exonuclease n=1 Tax=Sulfurimonas denitrificans (strain ATCC 33889 / DSM 1251) TaxID=326298 RepID=Q30Q47_SULDN|nr:3'-5' exonuclease [Sulfurimonas denitrificans]ABB44884.1 Exonuclease [Sulfurimonas denitrificans DSM 1251]